MNRITQGRNAFVQTFGRAPDVISEAPGRAEILGCHTDYNHGFALGAGISRTMLGFFGRRRDGMIHLRSGAFPKDAVSFSMDHIQKDAKHPWSNYVRGVVSELVTAGHRISGADILFESTVPKAGGVSSSAALELATAYGLLALAGEPIDTMRVAQLSQRAENGPLVDSPCGFLDQGTIAYGEKNRLVLFDFDSMDINTVEADIDAHGLTFVISLDPGLERQLGTSAFVKRRRTCEESVPFWNATLEKPVTSLRDVTVEDFLRHADALERENPVMRKRVEHVIFENARVRDAVSALRDGNMKMFGGLLTQSGKSGLELFDLDEGTPQLTFLVSHGRTLPGVAGMRNMGGGFSAVALALVEKKRLEEFQETLQSAYIKKFKNQLEYIEFSPTQGARIIDG